MDMPSAAVDRHLLADDEPHPVTVERADGAAPIFLVCDHAGRRIPRRLGALGLDAAELDRHIAWDIGAESVARGVSRRLDATLVSQVYSRLVIDCNRAPGVDGSIATLSETTAIPGNRDLGPRDAETRAREIFRPYHDTITRLLDARAARDRPSVLVAVHSFTPVFKGEQRPWHIGILYNRDDRLAAIALDLLAGESDLRAGDNQPYSVSDETDYTIPVHGEKRGLAHVEIEIRQDLIADAPRQDVWADRLAGWLVRGLDRLGD